MTDKPQLPFFDTHVCLISKQAAANLLPAIDPKIGPKYIVLATTPEMTQEAQRLESAIKQCLPQTKFETVNLPSAYDFIALSDFFLNLFSRLREEGRSPAVNLTGGTKPMSFAALQCAKCADLPCFYLEITRNTATFLEAPYVETRLSFNQNTSAYLLAYGLKLQKPEPRKLPFTEKLRKLADNLANTKSFRSCYPVINRLASEAAKNDQLSVECRNISQSANALLDEFERCGLLEVHGTRITFKSKEARFFVNGGWLEDLTAYVAQTAFPSSKVISNAQIERQASPQSLPVRNELDALFWVGDNLCIVECKTSSLEEDAKSQSVLYKLSSNEKRFGLKVIPILVSYLPLDEPARERAKQMGIRVIAGNDLKRLSERLKHFAGGHE